MIKNLSIFLFFTAAAGLFWFWTKPNLAEIDQLMIQKTAIEKALASSRELQEIRNRLLEEYGLVSPEDQERLAKMIPADAEIAKLLIEIDNIAKGSGVIIKQFDAAASQKTLAAKPSSPSYGQGQLTPVAQDEKSFYAESMLTFDVAASYSSFKTLLEEFQKSLRLIDVMGVKFSSHEKDFYDFSIQAKTYSLQ